MRWMAILALALMLAPARASADVIQLPDGVTDPSSGFRGSWLERRLTLPAFAWSGDVALGVGQSTSVAPVPQYDTPLGTRLPGAGLDVEAALGFPAGFEVGARLGLRFGPNGALTNADAYGRLYDPLSLRVDAGNYSFANPELRVTEAFVDGGAAAVAFEARLTPAFAAGSGNVLVLGLPLRFRVPRLLRIDTGVHVPLNFGPRGGWALEMPLAAWFQEGRFFVGPLSGLYWNDPAWGARGGGWPRVLDIHAGVGLGYTLSRHLELKAELLTTRANHADWASYIGGSAGVGVFLP